MAGLVLSDDHVVFVDALCVLLDRDDHDVVAVAHTLRDTIATLEKYRPDIALIDRKFPDGDALESIGELIDASPGTRIIFLAADQDNHAANRALRAGAHGYVSKMCGVTVVQSAIDAALDDEKVIDLSTRRFRRDQVSTDVRRRAAHLTGRERECLELLVTGAGTTAIVKRMGVSPTTVRTHIQSLLTKLGAHSRLEAASIAVRYALLEDHAVSASGWTRRSG